MKNKNLLFLRKSFVWLPLFAIAIASCNRNNDQTGTAQITVAATVEANASFSILSRALDRAGLKSTVGTAQNITVFAPNNDAFANANITLATINSMDSTTLRSILLYHVLGVRVGSTAVPVSDSVRTLQNNLVFASRNTNGVFVNGVAVTQADVAASNGVIHVIRGVLTPPTASIAQAATTDTSLSFLAAAVVRAGLLSTIQGAGKFTVFAPNNQAFRNAGFASVAAIQAADATVVANIVRSHIIATNVFSSDLTASGQQTSLNGALQFSTGTTAGVKLASSTNAFSNIIRANIVTTNGVVHVVDRVIL